jgi:hypothetical protein
VWSVDRSARRVVESGARWPEEFNIDRVLCIVFFLTGTRCVGLMQCM